eukprot:jgi/Chrzof1/7621/Cz02g30160.t1
MAINGVLWFAYGLAIKDMFIAVPNGVGAAFNLVCLALCWVFPHKEQPSAHHDVMQHNTVTSMGSNTAAHLATVGNTAGADGGPCNRRFFDLSQMRWRAATHLKQLPSLGSEGLNGSAISALPGLPQVGTQAGANSKFQSPKRLRAGDIENGNCDLDQTKLRSQHDNKDPAVCNINGQQQEHVKGLCTEGDDNSGEGRSSTDAEIVVQSNTPVAGQLPPDSKPKL